MNERDARELMRLTGLPVESCREALEQNRGDIGAAHRVLVIQKNRDRADAARHTGSIMARNTETRQAAQDLHWCRDDSPTDRAIKGPR